MPGDCESEPADGPDRDEEEEEARRFILQVKETVERCLRQGMDKAQMFQVIREEGLPPEIAFAVYKQLREQNHGFFKEYYSMIDLKEQRQRFDRLIQAYRARGSNVVNATVAGARAPATAAAATPASMELDIPVDDAWPNKHAVQDWSDETTQLDSARGGGGDPLALRLPAGQPVTNHGHPVAEGVLPGLPWPLPDAGEQQLGYHQQPVCDGGVEVAWHQQAMHLAPVHELHYQEQPAANDGGVQDQVVAWHQQGEMHLPEAQLLHSHEQLVMADAGFHAVPLASAVGLSSNSMMASCPSSTHGGLWYGWHGR